MLTCHVCPPFLHDKVITTHYSGFRLGTRSVNSSLMCMQLCAWGQKVKYRHQVSTSQTIPRHRLHQESSRRSSLPSSRRMCTIVTLLSPDHQDTLLTSCSVYWTLHRISSLAHASSITACHTRYTRNCTGSTSQNVSTTNWESQCIAVCRTRLRSIWSTAVHQSQTFPADVIYSQPLDIAWPYHVTGSAFSVIVLFLSEVQQPGTRYRTVSATRRSAATASDNR